VLDEAGEHKPSRQFHHLQLAVLHKLFRDKAVSQSNVVVFVSENRSGRVIGIHHLEPQSVWHPSNITKLTIEEIFQCFLSKAIAAIDEYFKFCSF
jgi:hypothetical protein